MSFVTDQVRRLDAAWDHVSIATLRSSVDAAAAAAAHESSQLHDREIDLETGLSLRPESKSELPDTTPHEQISPRILALQTAIRSLSAPPTTTYSSRSLLKPTQIAAALSALSQDDSQVSARSLGFLRYEGELEWLLAAKATTQAYGCVLDTILSTAVRLADDVWYWEGVLGSRTGLAIYGIQAAPWQLWDFGNAVWEDVKEKSGAIWARVEDGSLGQEQEKNVVQASWGQLYALVRKVVRERNMRNVRSRILGPLTRVHTTVREKQAHLRDVRSRNGNALGVLLGEGLANESLHGEGLVGSKAENRPQHEWKASVARNVALMEAVLAKVNDLEIDAEKFDVAIAELTEDDPLYTCEVYRDGNNGGVSARPQDVAERLSRVLALSLPQYTNSTKLLQTRFGRPSRLVRYWLPVTIGILSSSTVLRILANRQAEFTQWVRDLGATTIDFWRNWVIEPTRHVIQTIRHDESAEVSIMSKRSLEGDRASLERMVVEFAIDNPVDATGSSSKLTETQIADIRAKVQEGDLTPVLRAYEKDLSSPFIGTIRGNLIRALLIQVQKTKVDVEVAIGGIDALLKSQELVFGFVGLTPGILVTYFALRSLRDSLSSRRRTSSDRSHGIALRQLRNIDRILVDATPTEFGELPYRDQGLLLCEVHVLRQAAVRSMPTSIYREFGEEADQLCDVRLGVNKQKQVADRIRWAYGQWLS